MISHSPGDLGKITGTGKTKLAIAMLYRLLATKRFRRICFVVDRSALGIQAAGEFSTTKIVSGKAFADIFGLKKLEDVTPDSETKVHMHIQRRRELGSAIKGIYDEQ